VRLDAAMIGIGDLLAIRQGEDLDGWAISSVPVKR
jgi:hypothetical protein